MLFFLTLVFLVTILYKKVNITKYEEELLSIDPKFDIVNPSFTINNDNEKISVSANKGNFLNNDLILLKNNVFFESSNFKIFSDEVTFNKKDQTAESKTDSTFESKGTKIIAEGFSIKDKGNIILFNGKTLVVLQQ